MQKGEVYGRAMIRERIASVDVIDAATFHRDRRTIYDGRFLRIRSCPSTDSARYRSDNARELRESVAGFAMILSSRARSIPRASAADPFSYGFTSYSNIRPALALE